MGGKCKRCRLATHTRIAIVEEVVVVATVHPLAVRELVLLDHETLEFVR